MSFIITGWITVVALITTGQAFHWFVVPVFACGVIIGADAVDWARGRLGLLDPIAALGIFGYHFFFLAPLLHVHWEYWMRYVVHPPDWRPWLGTFAALNAAGLVLYRWVRRSEVLSAKRRTLRVTWQLHEPTFYRTASLALGATAAIQVWIYASGGGISGYLREYIFSQEPFQGQGWLFAISESFPILCMIVFAVYAHGKRWAASYYTLSLVFLSFLVLKFLFGGLRGSRLTTVFDLLWAVGMIHIWVRRISKRLIVVGCVFVLLFLYLYGFYKEKDLVASGGLGSSAAREAAEARGRSVQGLLLGDLARSDVQAFLLYRVETFPYQRAWGRTYVGDVFALVPSSILAEKPPSKLKWGTEAQSGLGSYTDRKSASTRLYGITGEALLNFGRLAVPFAFIPLALFALWVRRAGAVLPYRDARLLLYPYLLCLCPILLLTDLDNVLVNIVTHGLLPTTVLLVSSARVATGASGGREPCSPK